MFHNPKTFRTVICLLYYRFCCVRACFYLLCWLPSFLPSTTLLKKISNGVGPFIYFFIQNYLRKNLRKWNINVLQLVKAASSTYFTFSTSSTSLIDVECSGLVLLFATVRMNSTYVTLTKGTEPSFPSIPQNLFGCVHVELGAPYVSA